MQLALIMTMVIDANADKIDDDDDKGDDDDDDDEGDDDEKVTL